MTTAKLLRRSWGALLLGLALSGLSTPGGSPAQAGTCTQAVGPFQSQYAAYQMLQEAQARGYRTGPVYGQGGLYSNYSNRRWFFTVYYAC